MANLPQQTLYIGGRFVDARSGHSFETLNPATGKPICAVRAAGAEDVESAVQTARDGFAVWSAMTGAERGRILNRAAGLLRECNDTPFGLRAGVITRDIQRGRPGRR